METKKLYGIIAVCLIVALVIILSFVLKKEAVPPGGELPTGGEEVQEPSLERDGHVADIPSDAVVTVPVSEAPAAPDADERFRVYTLSVSAGGFVPDRIVVNKGDVVQLNIGAVGGTYDFSMPYTGLSQLIPSGESRQVSFGATSEGTFEFKCSAACPASGVIRGQLIVLP